MKLLGVNEDVAAALELASQFCNTLVAVEHAYMLEDEADLGNILGGLDPSEIRMTAEVIRALWMTWTVLPNVGPEPRASLSAVPTAPSPDEQQSSGPTLHSVKVV